jgi:hypothetical protein
MAEITPEKYPGRYLVWAFTLGAVGLVCGYSGQFWLLKTGDSLGPMLGIILTGPAGFILGIVLGGLSSKYQLNAWRNVLFLAIAILVVGVGSLYLTVSDYHPVIQLVDAEIIGCETPDKLLVDQTKYWSEAQGTPNRPNWQQELPEMVRTQPGAVLTLRIHRETQVRQQHWRWGEVSTKVDRWKNTNETKKAFGASTSSDSHSLCGQFTVGARHYSSLAWEEFDLIPPEKLSSFLWLPVLQQVPAAYISYLPNDRTESNNAVTR